MKLFEIGVFSASLHPSTPDELIERMNRLHLRVMQLALIDSAWRKGDTIERLEELLDEHDIEIQAGFFGFSGEDYSSIPNIRDTGGFAVEFEKRMKVLRDVIEIADRLGIAAIGGHAGFIPEDRDDPMYDTMIERVGEVADAMDEVGMQLLLETGQETPENLLQVIEDLDRFNVGINLDPANLLLYGAGDPVEAVRVLGTHILSVHAKDAMASPKADVWGRETLLGEGEVPYPRFLAALKEAGFTGPLIIECEMGGRPEDDVKHARDMLTGWLAKLGVER
jgi:sugar phosphate isomerase/epimerase